MRDIHNAAATIFQLTDDGEQMVHFLFRQRGRRFVHNDDFCIVGKRLSDFDHLHLRNGQLTDLVARVDINIQFVENRLGVFVHFVLIDK
ncbi:hypothetical protein SRABI106_03116 [Rahnella aquatilis]|nr:hypothetical protein SRABI106_03116 [Rahnella aquatilis]